MSTRFWQYSTSDDRSRIVGVQHPVPFSAADWFAGNDPALAAVESGLAIPLTLTLLARGGDEAMRRYFELRAGLGDATNWWQPFEHRTMRRLGDSLHAAGRRQDGNAAYRLNVVHFPCDWRSWDSEAAGRLAVADSSVAYAAFRRALELDPDNWNSATQRAAVSRLQRWASAPRGDEERACPGSRPVPNEALLRR